MAKFQLKKFNKLGKSSQEIDDETLRELMIATLSVLQLDSEFDVRYFEIDYGAAYENLRLGEYLELFPEAFSKVGHFVNFFNLNLVPEEYSGFQNIPVYSGDYIEFGETENVTKEMVFNDEVTVNQMEFHFSVPGVSVFADPNWRGLVMKSIEQSKEVTRIRQESFEFLNWAFQQIDEFFECNHVFDDGTCSSCGRFFTDEDYYNKEFGKTPSGSVEASVSAKSSNNQPSYCDECGEQFAKETSKFCGNCGNKR